MAVLTAYLAITTNGSPTPSKLKYRGHPSKYHGPPAKYNPGSGAPKAMPPGVKPRPLLYEVPANVTAERQKYAQNKYLEYTKARAKRLANRNDKPNKIDCDPMDEKKELPFSELQAGLTDQCNNLDNILNNRVAGVTIQPLSRNQADMMQMWDFNLVADPTFGVVRYVGQEVEGNKVQFWTEREGFIENTSQDALPYRTREDEPRSVGWWYEGPAWADFSWNECFDGYWNIAFSCERPGVNFWGSTGGSNQVEDDTPPPPVVDPSSSQFSRFIIRAIHVFDNITP
ncbi:hypothetical protein TWF694_004613 [Orbilia ellipsospora]|uniref:Uncharacterized protein n=1 Tax=Orbilia ellipsospora TaxID=2528407 RepID=A0AAV9WVM6_9PEZI